MGYISNVKKIKKMQKCFSANWVASYQFWLLQKNLKKIKEKNNTISGLI